jgi:hypothetical protein
MAEQEPSMIADETAYKFRRSSVKNTLTFLYQGRTASFKSVTCPLCGAKMKVEQVNLHEIVNRSRLKDEELWNLPLALHALICWSCNMNLREGEEADQTSTRLKLLAYNIDLMGRDTVTEALQYCPASIRIGFDTGLLRLEGDIYEIVHQSEVEDLLEKIL